MEQEEDKFIEINDIGKDVKKVYELSIDYQMAWWNMREWKKILRKQSISQRLW